MLKKPIVLWGFMGSGKTTVGQILADRLGLPFTDTDRLIEKRVGKTIAEIFAQEGEPTFRRWERQVLEDVLRNGKGVIAVGGGAPADPENIHLLKSRAFNVYLHVAPDLLFERLSSVDDRPLLQSSSDRYSVILSLLQRRLPFYQTADLFLPCGRREPCDIADQIAVWVETLSDDDAIVTVPIDERSYPVVIGQDLFERAGFFFKAVRLHSPFAIVEDEAVSEPYGRVLEQSLSQMGKTFKRSVPCGEACKTPGWASVLWSWLASGRLGRDSTLVALGGGACGDLVTFLAGTFLRGIAFVQAPTTLLAMVDSAVGGKGAVDLPEGKNLVGVFHQPRLVLSHLSSLHSLPQRAFLSGLAEVVKYGIIADPDLLCYLSVEADAIFARSPIALKSIIARSVAIKSSFVSRDEKEESGLRMILNYGHTFGHALEAATGFALLHGEAVAIGMVAEAFLSWRLGLCERSVVDLLEEVVRSLDLPARLSDAAVPTPDLDTLLNYMSRDKKRKGGTLRMALINNIGNPLIYEEPITDKLIGDAWSYVLR